MGAQYTRFNPSLKCNVYSHDLRNVNDFMLNKDQFEAM